MVSLVLNIRQVVLVPTVERTHLAFFHESQ